LEFFEQQENCKLLKEDLYNGAVQIFSHSAGEFVSQ